MTNDNIEALQEILDVPNGVVLFRGDLILPHKDVVELMQYIQQHYDMDAKEGMKLKGKHLLVPDLEHNRIVQGKEETVVIPEIPEKVKDPVNYWERFWRLCLVLWFIMVSLNIATNLV